MKGIKVIPFYLLLVDPAYGGTTPFLVGWTRFELATPRPPDVCATGLRHHPKTLKSNLYQSFFHRAANIGLKEIFKLYL